MSIRVEVVKYVVSAVPEDDHDSSHMSYGPHFDITVEYRGRGLWAVCHFGECLGTDGEWSYESSPSNREDDWLATHRFDLTHALQLAREAAPNIRVNRFVAHEVAAEIAASKTKEPEDDACCDEAYVDAHGRTGHQPWCVNK